MRNYLKNLLGVVALVVALVAPAAAQVPSLPPPPYNLDLSVVGASTVPLIKNTVQGPATVNSPAQNNLANVGVACTINDTVHSGSPSTTIAIQFFDAASATWSTLATSAAVTAISTPDTIVMHAGAPTVTTGTVQSTSLHLPRVWRVQEVVSGANTAITGTVGCNVLK